MRSGLAAGRHAAIKDYDLRWRFPHKTYLIFPTELARIMIIVSVLDSLHLGPWGTWVNGYNDSCPDFSKEHFFKKLKNILDLKIEECSIWCNDIILYIYKRKLNRWTISLPTYILQRPSKEEKESYHFQTLHISYFPKVAADDSEKSKTAPFTWLWHR